MTNLSRSPPRSRRSNSPTNPHLHLPSPPSSTLTRRQVSLSNSTPPSRSALYPPRVSPPSRARAMGNGRKRRRAAGELGRVAEIVMVLAAAGEARAGRAPTAAERALAAEARARLAEAVAAAAGEVRPKELFPREAMRTLVEDLALSRARDPAAMGYRPHRASIAERILLTRRKMEEVKESPVHPTTIVPQTTTSSATTVFHHGASKSTAGSPRNISAVASFPATAPVTMSSPNILKQTILNETPAGASSVKSASIPSIVSLPPVGSANIKVEKGVNGPNFTQSGATIGQANKSVHSTATRSIQNTIQSSSQAGKSQDKKAIQPVTGNTVMGQQSIFSNHNSIAKNVQQILHQPANHPSWTLPSTEYMHAQLDCQICKASITDVESLLVCDACERGVHLKCLKHYGNKGLPKAEWYCPTCVAHSKGKPLPPKYGKVARTIVAPKASVTSGVTSQRASEHPTTKDNNQNVAENGSVLKQNSSEADRAVHNSDTLALNTTSSKAQSVSASGSQKENVKHAETSSKQKEGHGPPCSGVVTETVKPCNEIQNNGASAYGGAGNLSKRSHMQSESSELPSCAVNSVNDSTLQSSAISGIKNSDYSFIVSSEQKHGTEGNSDQHPRKHVQITSSSRTPTDERHQADGAAVNGIGKPQDEETTEENAMSEASEHSNAHQVTSNGDICPKHEVVGGPKDKAVGRSTYLSVVDWVGDALKIVDNKTYYNSCSVDGTAYNLQDHILIASKDSKSAPSMLQSLWEEHDSRSKLAMVNPYLFASDIPESMSKPCTVDENEVYASNNQIMVMVSAICGPCQVLHVDKFKETKRRSQVVSSDSRLHPIFFCRWKYDESTSSFNSVDS